MMTPIELDGLTITHSSNRTGPPDLRLIHYNDVYHVEMSLRMEGRWSLSWGRARVAGSRVSCLPALRRNLQAGRGQLFS